MNQANAARKLVLPGSNQNPMVLQSPRVGVSPFYWASREHGVAVYDMYSHHLHPRHYGDPVAEYWHLLNHVTMWDVGGAERQVEITGPDAFRFVNMLVPRDLNKCKVGQCKYVFITAEDGGIINDPVLLRLGENHFWLSLADSDVLLWAKGLAYGLGMNVNICEPDVGPIQVQGPKAPAVISDLFGDDILSTGYYNLFERELDGMSVVVSRTGFSGELGFEIYLRNASRDGSKLWNTVWEAGQPHNIMVTGPGHIRRIEGGFLSWGRRNDIWYDTNPYEVGYGYEYTWMVELDQEADFMGKAALQRIHDEGPKRKLVGVEIDGPNVGTFNDGSMLDNYPVYDRNSRQLVGKVTSACWSPRLERNIGMAFVPWEMSNVGRNLVIETHTGDEQHGPQDAMVVTKPHIDPMKDAPKQDLVA